VGSPAWLNIPQPEGEGAVVVLAFEKEVIAYFTIRQQYRQGLAGLIDKLLPHYKLSLLSGDHDGQRQKLQEFFPAGTVMDFNQRPQDKLAYIARLQADGSKVLMVGDGLNDAGALRQAEGGISIADDVNAFAPACDIIMDAGQFHRMDRLLQFSRYCHSIVIVSFVISFLYNLIGLSLAVQGLLSPVFAAILMPISSVTVVGFVSLAVNLKSLFR
jgi:Cu+-exporting ATPase